MVDWISLSQLSGSGDAEVTVTASSYTDFYERYSQLLISGVSKSVTVYINQFPDVPPMDGQYFTLECVGSVPGVVYIDASVDYSVNGGAWEEYDLVSLTLQPGDKVRLRGTHGGSSSMILDNGASRYRIYGNTMSLFYGDDFGGKTVFPTGFGVGGLGEAFSGFTGLVDAGYLVLPATSDTLHYGYMFANCTNLAHAPRILPSLTLSGMTYYYMFLNCTSLVDAPQLPATELSGSCYYGMFSGCTSLAVAPQLPATVLGTSCYLGMFANCSSLQFAPALPATTLAEHCYNNMFANCTSLTTAPELRATTLPEHCYRTMFAGCASLKHIMCLATSRPYTSSTESWVYGVNATGTFVKSSEATFWGTGNNGIPNNWTVENV